MSEPQDAESVQTVQVPYAPQRSVVEVQLDDILPSPLNPRKTFDDAAMQDLVESVKASGVQVPIILRPREGEGDQQYEIVCGERRWRAAVRAGQSTIPAEIRVLSDSDAQQLAVIENLQRADLSPLEEARGYADLIDQEAARDHALTIEGLSLKVGKSQSHVAQRLALLRLRDEAKTLMAQGDISLGYALQLAKLGDADQERAIRWLLSRTQQVNQSMKLPEIVKPRNSENAYYNRGVRVTYTEKELQQWIRENVLLVLTNAPWALDDATLVPVAGACNGCAFRSVSNPALFGDLAGEEDRCLGPDCYATKLKAFGKRAAKAAQESGETYVRITDKVSYRPVAEVKSGMLLRAGQWLHVKKKTCASQCKGVYADGDKVGQAIEVCPDQHCKVHKHTTETAPKQGETTDDWTRRQQEERRVLELLKATEQPVREKVLTAILGRQNVESAVRLVASDVDNAPAYRKSLLERWPALKKDVFAVAALVVVLDRFHHRTLANGWQLVQSGGVASDRRLLWDLAKYAGVDADKIAIAHFQSLAEIPPEAKKLLPKGYKAPAAKKPAAKKKEAKPAVAKKPARKNKHA